GAREEQRFKEGQNVMLVSPGGDHRQALVLPHAENDAHGRPDHASDDSETYQFETLRVTKKKDTYEIWLADSDSSGGNGSGGSSGSSGAGTAKSKVRINSDGGITGRVGEVRFAAHSSGAKIRANDAFLVVVPGRVISSHPIQVDADPIPNDDA